MTTTTDRHPQMADTSNMAVVHSAMRRDVVRTRLLLDSPVATQTDTRQRLARHLHWFLDFLDHHHAAEDAWLWPVLRARGQAELADALEGEHAAVARAVEELRTAVAAYGAGHSAPATLQSAVDKVASLLAMHLAAEDRAMPLVGQLITRREWMAFEKEGALKGRSMRELGWDANWIMDGTTEEQRRQFLQGVPRLARLLVFDRFANAYRRDRDELWGGTPAADVPSLDATEFRAGPAEHGD